MPQFAPIPYKPHPGFSEQHLRALDAHKIPHDFTMAAPPDYLDVVIGFMLLLLPVLHIPKTRTMLTSWATMHYITWHCQFHPAIEWVGQSEDDSKAMGLVEYANILYREQPEWLRNRYPLTRNSTEGTLHRIEWDHSSRFIGIPQGERKFASKHSHGYFNDETAHQAAAEATLNIVQPAVTQIINVSSAAPGWFGTQCAVNG